MRVLAALIAAVVLSSSLALQTGMTRRKHKLRPRQHRARQLKRDDEYRLMRAPKFINGLKKTRIGSRNVDREGITVNVGDDGSIGVNVNVTVDVGVSINTGGGSGGNGESEEEELECIEWNITYVPASSSKSSKSSSKSGKGSKSEGKSGKGSKSESKSGKAKSSKSGDSDDDMIPIEECVAYASKVPSIAPSMEPVPILTASPTETQEITTSSVSVFVAMT